VGASFLLQKINYPFLCACLWSVKWNYCILRVEIRTYENQIRSNWEWDCVWNTIRLCLFYHFFEKCQNQEFMGFVANDIKPSHSIGHSMVGLAELCIKSNGRVLMPSYLVLSRNRKQISGSNLHQTDVWKVWQFCAMIKFSPFSALLNRWSIFGLQMGHWFVLMIYHKFQHTSTNTRLRRWYRHYR